MSTHINGSRDENHQTATLHDRAVHRSLAATNRNAGAEPGKNAEEGMTDFWHEDIAVLAYRLWQARGCPEGSPEEDWFHAKQELRGRGEGRQGVTARGKDPTR